MPFIRHLPRSQAGPSTVRQKSVGPSTSTLLWTLYVILLVATAVALFTLMRGQDPASAGAATLLYRLIATLAKTMKASQDDQHDTELAEARKEIGQLRGDLQLRTRDFDDLGIINADLSNQLAKAVDDLCTAKARIAELEAADTPARRAGGRDQHPLGGRRLSGNGMVAVVRTIAPGAPGQVGERRKSEPRWS
jgi:hypothetical protein